MLDALAAYCKKIAENLSMWGIEIPEAIIFIILIIIFTVIGIINALPPCKAFIIGAYNKIRNIQTKKWREKYKNSQLSNYEDYLDKKNYDLFIDTKFTVTPPHDFKDPSELESLEAGKNILDFYLKNVFVSRNTSNRLYCILAGSGMGKTTFSMHLFVEYINKYNEKTLPFEIRFLSLAHKDAIKQIKSIENKGKTILILDALDENQYAAKDFETFKNKLEEAVELFKIVVITCRTQFFKSSDEEPKESSLLKFTREKGFQKYIKHYISPFTDEDINLYLNKKYKKKRNRKNAQNIIKKCKTLMVRPLLLSYIDDLIDSNLNDESYTVTQLYGILIDKWIQREVNMLKPEVNREYMKEKLFEFSNDLALNLFEHRKQRDGWYIDREDYDNFLIEKGYSDIQYSFDGRSLINRNSIGQIKFSHKSFFEYFIALHKYNCPNFKIPKEGMDMARAFYRSMVEDDITTYSLKKIFTLECPILSHLQSIAFLDNEDVLYIHEKTSYNFTRIFKLYEEGYMDSSLSSLQIKAESIDINLIDALVNTRIRSIYVKECTHTDLSPLLCIPSLSYLNIENINNQIPISYSFITKAKERKITVVIDNDVYNISTDSTAYLPLSIRLYLLQNKQRINIARMIDERK